MTTLESGLSKDYRPRSWGRPTWRGWCVVPSACSIHYWSEAGGEQVQPTVGTDQYGGWIDEATGEIYFMRIGNTAYPCAGGSRSGAPTLGSSTSTILATLPPGFAGFEMSLAPNTVTSHQDLYFNRWSCKHETGDIYALRGVDTV